MFPSLVQRGESDSQLNAESCEESHPVLSRCNSESYLLQMGKQKEKEIRKGCRTKGYMVMDVKLGGLGPDYEAVKEKRPKCQVIDNLLKEERRRHLVEVRPINKAKQFFGWKPWLLPSWLPQSEKIKQQKEYAKQVKEHNMKNISSARKPQPKPENKSAASRQKALEYAKTIPKPKLYVSKPSEQEPKEGKNLAHTLNGENLPPISSLESLQNRHEKEKKVVAAFKTLHIV